MSIDDLRRERDRQLMELVDALQDALRNLIRELRREIGGRYPPGSEWLQKRREQQ